jgi:hypothetical protein
MPTELSSHLQELLLKPLAHSDFSKLSDSDRFQLFTFLILKKDITNREKNAFGFLYSLQTTETRHAWIMDAITEGATWTIPYILYHISSTSELSSLYDALELNCDPQAALEVYQSALDTPVPEQLANQIIAILGLASTDDPTEYLLKNRPTVMAAIARMNSVARPPLLRSRSSENIAEISSVATSPAPLLRSRSSENIADFSFDDNDEVSVSVVFQSPRITYAHIRGKFVQLPIASPRYSIRNSEVINLIVEAHLIISRSLSSYTVEKQYIAKLKTLLERSKPFLQEASAALAYAIKFNLEEMFFILLECGSNPFLSIQGIDSAYDLAFKLSQTGSSYYLESFIELGIYPSPLRYSLLDLQEHILIAVCNDMSRNLIINFEGTEVDKETKTLLQKIFRCLNDLLETRTLTTLDSKREIWHNILTSEKSHPRVKPYFDNILAVLSDDTQTQEILKAKIADIANDFVSKVTTPQFSVLPLSVFQNPTTLSTRSALRFHIPQHPYYQQVDLFNLIRLTWFDIIMHNPIENRFQLIWILPTSAQQLITAQIDATLVPRIEYIERVTSTLTLFIEDREPNQHSPYSLSWYFAAYQLTYARHSFTYIFTEAIPVLDRTSVDYYLSNNFFWRSLRLGSATILTFSQFSEMTKIVSILSTECIMTLHEISYNYIHASLTPYLGEFFSSLTINSFVAIATTITLSPVIYIPITSALLTSATVTTINYQTHYYENNLNFLSQAMIFCTSAIVASKQSQLFQPSDSQMSTFSKAMVFANVFALAHKTHTCITLALQDYIGITDSQDQDYNILDQNDYY